MQNNQKYKPSMLMILDGWGISESSVGNAVMAASTPNLDYLIRNFPNTKIKTSGLAVGLPDGQMGNSEVGHLNIGAGRTVLQSLTRISLDIEKGDFFTNAALLDAVKNSKKNDSPFHIMGLIGPGGVHSHGDHLNALLKLAKQHDLNKVYIHAFLDGRDTPPRSAKEYLEDLENAISEIGTGRIVTISGRYYAMDRDNRWDRIQKAYDALTLGNGIQSRSAIDAIREAYEADENDEFVMPRNICAQGDEPVTINDGDSVVFFNFRPDRAREITRAFVDEDFSGFARTKTLKDLLFVTMTEYDDTIKNVEIAYPNETIKNTLGEYISNLGLSQLRIAETEKYAHVTFFFNGGIEEPFNNEERILIPSPKVATYDLQPEMSAYLVTEKVVDAILKKQFDLIILNFANMDMVGHTGKMDAAIMAVNAVDECVGEIYKAILEVDGQLLISADHGNSENMLDDNNEVVTSHSTNPVPLILVRKDAEKLSLEDGGVLSDLAPTLLDMMGIKQPEEMTGKSLLV